MADSKENYLLDLGSERVKKMMYHFQWLLTWSKIRSKRMGSENGSLEISVSFLNDFCGLIQVKEFHSIAWDRLTFPIFLTFLSICQFYAL